jgi:hypothetical protein
MPAEPRTGLQRRADTLAKLETREADVWVGTASSSGAAYLVPLSYAWDGRCVILAADATSPTARNIAASGQARLGFGPTRDVVMMDVALDRVVSVAEAPADLADAYARQSDWDPRIEEGGYVYLLLTPRGIQAWRESNELAGRRLMRDGTWLV